jgi:hypothetical protein
LGLLKVREGASQGLKDVVVYCVGSEHFSWCAKEIPREIVRSQNPLSCPSQKKRVQRDVTAKSALKSRLRKMQQIFK